MAAEGDENSSVNLEQQHQPDWPNNIFMKRKIFNDPIHGTMEIHPVCVRIMDTPQFQRLRHIKQLDACYLVYPGASHNRFEHSIGVSYLAGKLLKTIKEHQPEENITERDILCVEIAGLCHDLGQGPFSHVFEKRFMPAVDKSKYFKHEAMARKMFEDMLDSNGGELKKDIQKILGECNIPDFQGFEEHDFTFIKEMIDVPPEDIEKRSIVANKRNGIDVDRWDYLARDSHMLGIKIHFDGNRCFATARVLKCNGLERTFARKQICYREKTEKFNLDQVRNGINRYLQGEDKFPVKDLIEYDVVRLDYGMKDRNPLEEMRFYTKDKPNDGIKFEGKQVSYLLPQTFEEVIIRIYCKPRMEENGTDEPDQSDIAKIREAVNKLQKEY
ncbi:deoxynucleoside triphosphate triphosphohydrolase SAMHD1-like [Ruditapes philippinarum]|uniref:deoxynucleoside triphosphate triphosphohydrolase SAMHD1-like n=1 Tax=Ruditapes philippinarum TaxID=129788 RepID=UPI00295B8A50|nr:deoxynucleoside triphosphate triphosphohydrolase SAMHD1-like [Ruditapes philippinarum]